MTSNSNKFIMLALDEYVHGHVEAKRALITLLSRSKLRHHQKYIKEMHIDFLLTPMKVLLVGASGTGKTHLLESLRKIVHFPLVRVDATNLNPTGASGGIKSETLHKMINEEAIRCCTEMPNQYFSIDGAIDRMVVFVDEFDKLGRSFESSGNWNRHVQSNFLTTFDSKIEYAGVSFVFAGTFEEVTKSKEKAKLLGFNPDKQEEKKELLDTKILAGGLIPEIVGRLTSIVELDIFTKEQMYTILTTRLLPKKNIDMAAFYVFDIDVSEEDLLKISEDAVKSGQGVRYLQRALDRLYLEHEFNADADTYL